MAENSGWIKLHRQLKNWEWFKDAETLQLFIYCLLRANITDGTWRNIPYKRGQFIASLEGISSDTGLSIQQVRTRLKRLKLTGEITSKLTNKNTIITVCKFDDYQDTPNKTNTKTNTQANTNSTQNQHEDNTKSTIGKEIEENKEDKEEEIKESLNSLALNFFEEGISAKAKQLLYQLAQRNGIGDEVVDAFVMANLNNMGRNQDNSHPYAICDSKGVTIQKVAEAFIAFSTRHNDKVPPFDVVEKIFMKRIALKGGRANGLKASEFYEYLKSTGKQYKGEKGIVSAANAWINKRISQP